MEMSEQERQQLRHSSLVLDGFMAEDLGTDLADELAEARYTYRPFADRDAREARGAQPHAGWDPQVRRQRARAHARTPQFALRATAPLPSSLLLGPCTAARRAALVHPNARLLCAARANWHRANPFPLLSARRPAPGVPCSLPPPRPAPTARL